MVKRKDKPKESETESKNQAQDIEKIDSDCCICLDHLSKNKKIAKLNCEHYYCVPCIKTWAKKETSCPLCKGQFSSYQEINMTNKNKPSTKVVKVKTKRQGGSSFLPPRFFPPSFSSSSSTSSSSSSSSSTSSSTSSSSNSRVYFENRLISQLMTDSLGNMLLEAAGLYDNHIRFSFEEDDGEDDDDIVNDFVQFFVSNGSVRGNSRSPEVVDLTLLDDDPVESYSTPSRVIDLTEDEDVAVILD